MDNGLPAKRSAPECHQDMLSAQLFFALNKSSATRPAGVNTRLPEVRADTVLPGNKVATALRLYFRSGWAFLLPYLAMYLLYACLRWPVNSFTGREAANAIGEDNGGVLGTLAWIPCLLHVYWFLHLSHFVLGALVLRRWWRSSKEAEMLHGTASHLDLIARSSIPSGTGVRPLLARLWPMLPWACLALVFWIPGFYLEWPADPWEHLHRINEWQFADQVAAHSGWKKSSYFLPYSLASHATGLAQLHWLNVYYAGICMLLSWQYYRLARTIGLGARSSLILVLLQTLLMGNNLFSFHRYYGLSSSIFAQLGAVAVTRIALEGLRPKRDESGARSSIFHPGIAALASALAVFPLIAFNHIQGLGIAGLGVASVVIWRLIEWRRSMIGWLAVAGLALSAAVVWWWPRHPSFDAICRQQGWLNAWYGFNFFSSSSPAFRPTLAILGGFGMLNLAASILLLRSRHTAAWLTLIPVVLLSLPAIAVPTANILAASPALPDGGYLVTFSRMLLSIPTGMAIVACLERAFEWRGKFGSSAVYLGLLALVALPAGAPMYNRLFNALMVPPHDLAMRPALAALNPVPSDDRVPLTRAGNRLEELRGKYGGLVTSPGIGYALNATGATSIAHTQRLMTWPAITPPALSVSNTIGNLAFAERAHLRIASREPKTALFSPGSQSGQLSHHWLPQDAALQFAGQPELFRAVMAATPLPKQNPQLWLDWSDSHGASHAGLPSYPLPPFAVADRGALEAPIRIGEKVVFRPFLRSPNGNGWQVTLTVRGPSGVTRRDFIGLPDPLGGVGYVAGEYMTRFAVSGDYEIELVGKTLWPREIRTVRYQFTVHGP